MESTLISSGRRGPLNDYEIGTDTFVIRDGKIEVHSLAWKSVPRKG
jgi:hypothetical protein